MTIRYKCDECGVTMKIKDDLAGKKGKCPKCKNSFVVPAPGLPEDEVVEEEELQDEAEEEEEDEDDDDLLDMPMELTSSPVATPEPEVSRPRERKAASETKKPTRIRTAAQKRPKKKKSDDGEFDPTDVLFGDDDPVETPKAQRPRGRVLGLDEEEEAPAPRASRASMQDMFKDFTPAGGGAKKRTAEIDSTSAAAQALARQAEEKRAKASEPDPMFLQEEEEGADYVGAAKDFLSQYGLIIAGGALLIFGLGYGMNSMMSGKSDIPPLNQVYGTLTKGSSPIGGADIFFTPDESQLRTNNAGAIVITEPDGTYEVEYLPGYWGLPEGKYRVEVKSNGGMVGAKTVTIKGDMKNQLDLKF